jgi:hypothetical protein
MLVMAVLGEAAIVLSLLSVPVIQTKTLWNSVGLFRFGVEWFQARDRSRGVSVDNDSGPLLRN